MNYPLVNLTEICDLIIGRTPDRENMNYWGTGYPWVSISDMTGKYLETTREQITERAVNECGCKRIPSNTLLMSFKLTLGKLVITTRDVFTNEAIVALPIKEPRKVIIDYLYYALKNVDFLRFTDRAAKGRTLNKKKISKIQIPLPPLHIQKQIAQILDEADALIQKRKQAIAKLDELVQSVFLEMFGDPVTNPFGFKSSDIGSVTSLVSSGSTPLGGKSVYKTEGIVFIRSQNVLMNRIDLADVVFIDEETHEKMKRTWVKKEDVLFNITGASIGRVAVYRGEDNRANVNQHVCILRPKPEVIKSDFLCYFLSHKNYQKKILSQNAGATRQAFNFNQIKGFDIFLPPIQLQEKFSSIIQLIENKRAIMQQQLAKLEENFNSLLQRAFKGELQFRQAGEWNASQRGFSETVSPVEIHS